MAELLGESQENEARSSVSKSHAMKLVKLGEGRASIEPSYEMGGSVYTNLVCLSIACPTTREGHWPAGCTLFNHQLGWRCVAS